MGYGSPVQKLSPSRHRAIASSFCDECRRITLCFTATFNNLEKTLYKYLDNLVNHSKRIGCPNLSSCPRKFDTTHTTLVLAMMRISMTTGFFARFWQQGLPYLLPNSRTQCRAWLGILVICSFIAGFAPKLMAPRANS